MYQGLTLSELAAQIKANQVARADYIAPSEKLGLAVAPRPDEHPHPAGDVPPLRMLIEGQGEFGITDLAHEQIAGKLGIPQRYYHRMRNEAPHLLAQNANTWLNRSTDSRMVRTLDRNVRAFLSDRYKPMDNDLVAEAVLPPLLEIPDLKVISSQITERRMYLEVVAPRFTEEVVVGQPVQAGLLISNSEVGLGRLQLEMLLYFLVCKNGMVRGQGISKFHLGSRLGDESGGVSMFRDDTIAVSNRALALQMRDVVHQLLEEDLFKQEVAVLRAAAENRIPAMAVQHTIENVTQRYELSEGEGNGVLERLIAGGDLSQFGLSAAITNLANTVAETRYDRAIDLQRLGGRVIQVGEWSALVN